MASTDANPPRTYESDQKSIPDLKDEKDIGLEPVATTTAGESEGMHALCSLRGIRPTLTFLSFRVQ